MWRPLSPDENGRAYGLLEKASALLRQALPSVDDRIAAFAVDPRDPVGLDPVTVSMVVATMVKRFLSNVQGVASEGVGPYHVAYAIRGEKDVRGELQVTQTDLDALKPYSSKKSKLGSIRTSPAMAPWPFGRLGVAGAAAAEIGDSWLVENGTDGPSSEFPIYGIPYAGDS
jgi:hypothetical protein